MANLWNPLAPLLGEIDICAHWVLWSKFDFIQFLFKAFFNKSVLLAAFSPKILKAYSLSRGFVHIPVGVFIHSFFNITFESRGGGVRTRGNWRPKLRKMTKQKTDWNADRITLLTVKHTAYLTMMEQNKNGCASDGKGESRIRWHDKRDSKPNFGANETLHHVQNLEANY